MGNPSVTFWKMNPTSTTSAAPVRPIDSRQGAEEQPSVRFWKPIPSAMMVASWVGRQPVPRPVLGEVEHEEARRERRP